MNRKRNILIVLNGASSAGKTSIAQVLPTVLETPCVISGLDDVLERVRPFGVETTSALGPLQRNIRVMWFQWTDGRLRLFKQLHREVVAHVQAGGAVIVETALMDKRALRDAAECFAPLDGFFIGVKPPLAVSEQWEAMRRDRPRGHARKHYDLIHMHGIYDLVLDPSRMTPHECALTILHRLDSAPPDAFRRLLNTGG